MTEFEQPNGVKLACNFKYLKTRATLILLSPLKPEIFSSYNENSCFERLLRLELLQTSGKTHISNPLTKMLVGSLYFPRNCSNDLHFLVPLIQTFLAKRLQAESTELNHPHFLRIQKCKEEVSLKQFFPKDRYFVKKIAASSNATILISSRIGHYLFSMRT